QAQIESGDSTTLAAANQATSQAFANAQEALAQTESQLQAQIESGDSTTLAAANQTTSQAFANAQEALAETKTTLQTQVFDAQNALTDAATIDDVISQYRASLIAQDVEQERVALGYVKQQLAVESDRTKAQAQMLTELLSAKDAQQAFNRHVSRTFANAQEALSQTESQLQAQIESGDSTTLAAANQATSQAFANAQEALAQTE
ncbi:hypothetical protein, partial [Vibrio parahaemolyticus]